MSLSLTQLVHCMYNLTHHFIFGRMKILECKRGRIYDIGFVDPYFIHTDTLKLKPRETENNLVRALRFHSTKREILFPYNFRWVLLPCRHILFFCLLDVKCIIDSLCVRSYHYILLIIVPDQGLVKVMDPKRRPIAAFADMQECLQR